MIHLLVVVVDGNFVENRIIWQFVFTALLSNRTLGLLYLRLLIVRFCRGDKCIERNHININIFFHNLVDFTAN